MARAEPVTASYNGEKTPGYSSLPGVREERNAIIAAIGDNDNIITQDQPTVSSVTEHPGDCENFIAFAMA